MKPAAVLFDLDGTLVDSERECGEAMARALAGDGIEITQADRDFIIGRSWVDIHRHLRARYPALSWSRDQLIARAADELPGVIEELGLTVLPGARETVERFAVAGTPLALVTGSSRREASHSLEVLGLARHFEIVLAAEDVASSKPDPAGYLAAASALGAEPASCLVIEDSHAGIAAGIAAGARVVAVRAGNFSSQDQSAAHRVIESLLELTDGLIAEVWGMVPER